MVWPFGRRRRRGPFSRLESQDLDLLMLPQYATPEEEQAKQRNQIVSLIAEAGAESFDAGTREFLNNYINALADQAVAELRLQRDDALAIADAHIGLAAAEVARNAPAYQADLAWVTQTAAALAVTFEELTGRDAATYVPPSPQRADIGPVITTLGPIDVSDDVAVHIGEHETPPSAGAEPLDSPTPSKTAPPPRVALDDIPDPFAPPSGDGPKHRSHDDDQL